MTLDASWKAMKALLASLLKKIVQKSLIDSKEQPNNVFSKELFVIINSPCNFQSSNCHSITQFSNYHTPNIFPRMWQYMSNLLLTLL